MMELAYFYHWTLDYIRSLTIYEMDKAREYMIYMNKQSQGGDNGGQRHTSTSGRSNR